MSDELKLYFSPGACSRVVLVALEHIGVPYDAEMVNIHAQENKTPEYQAINPRGKVPALYIGDRLLTENAAIQIYLDQTYPEARLLPHAEDPVTQAQYLADLFWFSSTWHPAVRANRRPDAWTTTDQNGVREKGRELFAPLIAEAEKRLTETPWFHGDEWTILDAYLYWCYTTAEKGEYPLDGLPAVAAHRKAMEALPALQGALAREQAEIDRRGA